jgi:hypothetical protein
MGMKARFLEGHEFRDREGNLVCRAARDIYPGEGIWRDQFKDWQVPQPVLGEVLPFQVAEAVLR